LEQVVLESVQVEQVTELSLEQLARVGGGFTILIE
jgi:hypothetical protein